MGAPERQRAAQDCLRRIREQDSSIHAWVQVNPHPKPVKGPLAGIPFGVKDVIDVRGLVCELGSPLYKGHKPSKDAAVVARLKGLGAIVLGKTHTAQFAHTKPPITRNPRNLEHTPGGSSSGSAAAVAAGMAPFTLGTQTGGSVLRPIPMAVGNKLPLGLQLIAAPGKDSLLLNTAVQVARWIGSPAQ